jgi:hypothetical protein
MLVMLTTMYEYSRSDSHRTSLAARNTYNVVVVFMRYGLTMDTRGCDYARQRVHETQNIRCVCRWRVRRVVLNFKTFSKLLFSKYFYEILKNIFSSFKRVRSYRWLEIIHWIHAQKMFSTFISHTISFSYGRAITCFLSCQILLVYIWK